MDNLPRGIVMSAPGPKATVVEPDTQRIIDQFRNSFQGQDFTIRQFRNRLGLGVNDLSVIPSWDRETQIRQKIVRLSRDYPEIDWRDTVGSLHEQFDFLVDSQTRKLKIRIAAGDIDKLPQLTSGLQRLNIGVLDIVYSGNDIEQLKAILQSVKQVPLLAHIYIYTHFKDEEIKTLAPIISE